MQSEGKARVRRQNTTTDNTNTQTHTHTYTYIYICMCIYICIYITYLYLRLIAYIHPSSRGEKHTYVTSYTVYSWSKALFLLQGPRTRNQSNRRDRQTAKRACDPNSLQLKGLYLPIEGYNGTKLHANRARGLNKEQILHEYTHTHKHAYKYI